MRILYLSTLLFLSHFIHAQPTGASKIALQLQRRMAEEPTAFHSVHILMADRVNLAALDRSLAQTRIHSEQRANIVIRELQQKAAQTQPDLISELQQSPLVEGGSVRAYWITNLLFAKIKAELITRLSTDPRIAWIGLNGPLALNAAEETPPPLSYSPGGAEPGLKIINAPALWAMGYSGYGQLVFTNDTGVDPNPPTIKNQYRGHHVPKKQTWFEMDPFTFQRAERYEPYDCQRHGTHVTGTIVGLDRLTNDTIGVAFNAQWIGAPILCGIGTEDNVAAFQWALDPDENPNTTDDMPDVINNSWWDPNLIGQDCFSVYTEIEEALETAGIAVVFSAGNQGPGPMTITPPHNINIHEVSAFTVGALDGNSSLLNIANFSSRGPSICEGEEGSSIKIKPEVSAPGVNVRSCVPEGYTWLSGTSMAAPHVSGALLLLKEAYPYLTAKELKLALYHTCRDLGDPGEDNVYGMGVIDVLAAFQYLQNQGHVPVSPRKNRDLLLIDIVSVPMYCEQQVSPVILVENNGTDTITSFQIHAQAGTHTGNFTWQGVIAPSQRKHIAMPGFYMPAGYLDLKITVSNPNGQPDERPLNDVLTKKIFVARREKLKASVENGQPAICIGQRALLRANYHTSDVHVRWYDQPVGGQPLGEGRVFETNPLTQNTNFFAEGTYFLSVGANDPSIGPQILLDSNNVGLIFKVNSPIVLKSVKVFAEKTGVRLLRLLDEENNEIYQRTVSIPQSGENRININWKIQPGTYKIVKSGGRPLIANTDGAQYPYEVSEVIQILQPSADYPVKSGAWFFFYDWRIELPEPCGRTLVPIIVSTNSDTAQAAFLASRKSVQLDQNEPVQFTSLSDPGLHHFWNLGDGTISNDLHPSHLYSKEGTYIVSLVVSAVEVCPSYALDTIVIYPRSLSGVAPELPLVGEISVFPNPVRERLSVFLPTMSTNEPRLSAPFTLTIYDMTARPVKQLSFTTLPREVIQLELDDLPQGVYGLIAEWKEVKIIWKVIKI